MTDLLAVHIFASAMPIRINHHAELPQRIIEMIGRGMYQSDIARELGVSRQYVSQIASPVKSYARGTLHTAVRNGTIAVPLACENCGKERPLHGHHHNYLEALAVEWLCTACHSLKHLGTKRKSLKKPSGQTLPSEVASALAHLRWSRVSAEDRSAFGKKMAAARKHRQAKARGAK